MFGTQVLSHPLIVEAAEQHFVPICVYNNTKGDNDEKTLKRFKEPAWNNPVVRVLDSEGALVVPRLANDWRLSSLAERMVQGLEKAKRKVPLYLKLLAREQVGRRDGIDTAIFGMA